MTTCANCNNEFLQDNLSSSLFKIIDKQESATILNVIGELFGVNTDKLGQFIQNYQVNVGGVVPKICSMCLQILKSSFKWRNQFRNMCHPEGSLRSLLFDAEELHVTGIHEFNGSEILRSPSSLLLGIRDCEEQESNGSDGPSNKKPRLRNCSVVIKRLPHVYLTEQNDHCQPVVSSLETVNIKEEHCEMNNDYENSQTSDQGSNGSILKPEPNWEAADQKYEYESMESMDLSENPEPHIPEIELHFKAEPVSTLESLVKIETVHQECDEQKLRLTYVMDKADSEEEMLSNSESEESEPSLQTSDGFSRMDQVPPNDPTRKYSKIQSKKKYKCKEEGCTAEFPFEAELMSHVSFTHLRPPDWTPEMGFQCPIPSCGYTLQAYLSLTRHCCRHTNEKLFKCDIPFCTFKSFALKGMIRHLRQHAAVQSEPAAPPPDELRTNTILDMYTEHKADPSLFEFQCDSCPKTFGFKAELMSHSVVDHPDPLSDNTNFKCPEEDCELDFTFKFHLTTHLFTHTGETPFKCLQDGCSFQCSEGLEMRKHCLTHLQNVTPSSSSTFPCEVCGKVFNTRSAYTSHIKLHLLPYVCASCGEAFGSLDKLRWHDDRNHQLESSSVAQGPVVTPYPFGPRYIRIESKQKYKCEEKGCTAEFPLQAKLLSHVAVVHLKPQGWTPDDGYQCPVPTCDAVIKTLWNLNRHCGVHTKESLFKCNWPHCTFSSIAMGAVNNHFSKRHQRTNTELTGSSSEPSHEVVKDPNNPEGVFKCQDSNCNETFPFRANMLTHMSVYHFSRSGAGKNKKFRCILCSLTTARMHSMTEHMFTHTKEARHRCKVPGCGYLTSNSERFKRHSQIHEHN